MVSTPTHQGHDEIPEITSVWKHKKSGVLYTVVLITNVLASADRKDEYPITVCYTDEDGAQWSRPLSRWHDGMTLVANGKQP